MVGGAQGVLTKNFKNKQKHTKPPKTQPNLMDIKKQTVEGAPGGPYQKPQKPLSTNSQHHKKTPPNLMEINGKLQGCSRKPLSKNNQNHQNHQTPSNLMEIKGNGRGCPRKTLPKTTKTIKQKHYKN